MARFQLAAFAISALLASATSAGAADLDARIELALPSLVATYEHLHATPELSGHEKQTADFLVERLRALGFTVTERIGRYEEPGLSGYGIAAVLENGPGPTVLVRTELDALPVTEETGATYASSVRTINADGQEVGVMHACGHDLHMTVFLGTAQQLAGVRERWRGTLVMLGQPAEETGGGADAMLRDDLYGRVPRPDYVLAVHDSSELASGIIGYCPGLALANIDSVDITLRGLGGHGAMPDRTKDPVVLAAETVLALQTIVSREISPLDPAVVTVGSIHGGTKRNVIPDAVVLQLTVRTYEQDVRERVLDAIRRIPRGLAVAAGIPEDRMPVVTISTTERGDATYNDPALTERLVRIWEQAFAEEELVEIPPEMVSEDVGHLALERQIPLLQFRVGTVDPELLRRHRTEGTPLPPLHSSKFLPLPGPAIRNGVKAMTLAALDLLQE